MDEKDTTSKDGFEYLLSIRMSSMVLENAERHENKCVDLRRRIADLTGLNEFQLWARDLDDFEAKYLEFRANKASLAAAAETGLGKGKGKGKAVRKTTKK